MSHNNVLEFPAVQANVTPECGEYGFIQSLGKE